MGTANFYNKFPDNNNFSTPKEKTLTTGSTGLLIFLVLCTFSFHQIDAAGHIDLQIQELILRKPPTNCCQKDANCVNQSCSLDFRLCIGNTELIQSTTGILQSRKDCLIGAVNFSIPLHNLPEFDAANGSNSSRPLALHDFPIQRLNFTSIAIDSPNIFIELSILNGADGKLLLFSRQHANTLNAHNAPIILRYITFGNSLVYRVQVHCSPGFTGPKCAIFCEPPQPNDNYVCTENGPQCLMGWTGIGCTQPICTLPCQNGGRCIGPDKCACPTGWGGPECEKCKPRAGCQHGYCTDEPGKCFCHPNWTGPDCNLVVNKCLERPCKNGGICTTYGRHGDYFHCICPPGFIGIDCAISYEICKNASCGPNQRCAPLQNSYSCVCDPGFEGLECQQKRKEQRYDHQIATTPTSKQIKSPVNASEIVSNHPPPSSSSSQQFGDEFGVVKALMAACFLLLLIIIAILCCGQQNNWPCSSAMPKLIRHPKPMNPVSDADEDGGDDLPMTMVKGTKARGTFIRKMRPPIMHWSASSNSFSTTGGDDELDSGMGSIHSTNTPIGPIDLETQHRRLVHPWPTQQQMSIQSPPPPYEDSSLVWTIHHNSQSGTYSRGRDEAFV